MNPKVSIQVTLQGRNFLLDLEGQTRRYGFYTTRFVEAEDEAAAELAAVALVRDEPDLRDAVLNSRDDPPMLYMSGIQEIAPMPEQAKGHTFYPEEEDVERSDGSIGAIVTLKPRAG